MSDVQATDPSTHAPTLHGRRGRWSVSCHCLRPRRETWRVPAVLYGVRQRPCRKSLVESEDRPAIGREHAPWCCNARGVPAESGPEKPHDPWVPLLRGARLRTSSDHAVAAHRPQSGDMIGSFSVPRSKQKHVRVAALPRQNDWTMATTHSQLPPNEVTISK